MVPPIDELDDPFEEYSAPNYSENFVEGHAGEEEPEFREWVPPEPCVLENQYEEYSSSNRYQTKEADETPAARRSEPGNNEASQRHDDWVLCYAASRRWSERMKIRNP